MDLPREKMAIFISFFYCPPLLCHISETNWPTEMVHLSEFAGFHTENCQEAFKGLTQKMKILNKIKLKNNPNLRFSFHFTVPPTPAKRLEAGPE